MTQQPHATPPTEHGQQQAPGREEGRRQAEPAPGTGWGGPTPDDTSWRTGGMVFAGILMMVNGVVAVLQGISALATDDVYRRVGDYIYEISLTGWGVILLCLGAVAAAVGWGILQGAWWARITGIFLASLSMVAHFLFLPYSPVWSVLMVAIDFFVIWALATAPGRISASSRDTASAAR